MTSEERKAKKREYAREYRKKNPDYMKRWHKQNRAKTGDYGREAHLLYKYGISLRDYETMLAAQQGRCAICGAFPPADKVLFVDHCHDSGQVRGLLCYHCNLMLGHSKDTPSVLEAGAAYLRGAS